MNYILIGKSGSEISAIHAYLLSKGINCNTMIPADALIYKIDNTNIKVIYVKIPFYYHWDSVMLPDYWSENKRKIFIDEIMQFRNADETADVTFEYDGTGFTILVEEIEKWIGDNND